MKRQARPRRPALADHGEILTASQVGERLQLRPREVRRLFGDRAIVLGRKLVRYAWGDILAALDAHRHGNGGTA